MLIKDAVRKWRQKMRSLLPNLPLQNRKLAIVLAVFGIIGSVILIRSFAATTTKLTTITGNLEVWHYDNFEKRTDRLEHWLKTQDGRKVALEFEDRAPFLLSGTTIQASGQLIGDKFLVKRVGLQVLGYQKPVLAATTGLTQTKVVVILFNFLDDRSQPYTKEQAQKAIFTDVLSVKNFIKEANYASGQILEGKNGPSGEVYGWFTINHNKAGCDDSNWLSAAYDAAVAGGVNFDGYDYAIYANPPAWDCGTGGGAMIGGGASWINADFSSVWPGYWHLVAAHELSHNFGLNHSGVWHCNDTAGNRVTLSETCTFEDYGDPFDIMGCCGPKHHNNAHKLRLNWFGPSNLLQITNTGDYIIYPIEPTSSNTQVIKVPAGVRECAKAEMEGYGDPGLYCGFQNFYYLEYRQPSLFDSFAPSDPTVNGITIRSGPNSNAWDEYGGKTKLLDMHPSTADYYDAPMSNGQTFSDSIRGINITQLGHTTTSASIRIAGDFTPPLKPTNVRASQRGGSGVELVWNPSNDNLNLDGYMIFRNGKFRGTSNAASFIDTYFQPETNYVYTVVAYDKTGNLSTVSDGTPFRTNWTCISTLCIANDPTRL